ncbi:fae254d6-d8a0-4b2e-aaf8-cdc41208de99 [Sclerotinia trifoliorum]|uniref:Fae254d6-d8a0-4b2e-aaf8-cdc41208de99 n=1 Tax=Sclerotinia trifoliorum TaxID=28548 RepID=A0A8H2VRP9_9HELO|nr:fae254d6-d8a0-4b2e-aaf8-cdc41208de99 [Sclerotinia trifoliorum]
MALILCLAHYCDTHGPTPVMVTEALPVGCTSCPEKDEFIHRRPSTSRSFRSSEPSLNTNARSSNRTNSTVSEADVAASRPALHVNSNPSNASNTTGSAVETPPQSPRAPALQNTQNTTNNSRRDSSFRKTYPSEKPGPCENCALTLPKKTKEDTPTSPKPAAGGKLDNGPILRTRKPYERIAGQSTPPKSASSDSDDSECAIQKEEREDQHQARRSSIKRSDTSSPTYTTREFLSHNHFIDYTSTHEPLQPNSFSIIRQSCLRTLSCETLPPSSNPTPNTTPSSPFISSFSSHLASSTTTSSGGPIFFGDPMAGYTTAYIFRIPDPSARGRRRVYALIALSTQKERMAMRTFSFLDAAFRELADWIARLADEELARSESALQSPRLGDERNGNGNSNGAFGGGGATTTSTSSFLRGGNRGPDGRMVGASLKGRGLAELVGLPDFFIELHSRFVRLLAEIERPR